jgi:hypothetical protein
MASRSSLPRAEREHAAFLRREAARKASRQTALDELEQLTGYERDMLIGYAIGADPDMMIRSIRDLIAHRSPAFAARPEAGRS